MCTRMVKAMSGPRYSIIPGRAVEDRRLKLSHFRVLLYLGRFTNNHGWCWLYQERTGEALGITREHVNRCLGDLEKWGYLSRSHVNRYGKKIAAVRVFMDHGEPELPHLFPIDGDHNDQPDRPVLPPERGGNFTENSHQFPVSPVINAGHTHMSSDPQITGHVRHRSHDVCATDHRTCDLQLTCDLGDHTTCDLRDHTERLENDYRKGGGGYKAARAENAAHKKATTPTPDLKILFDEFCEAAHRAGFIRPDEKQFAALAPLIEKSRDAIGVTGWREALGYAAADDLCCGRGKVRDGFSHPWRLTIQKFCDIDWLRGKLAEWRVEQMSRPAEISTALMITPAHPNWLAWHGYYRAASPWKARTMLQAEKLAVPCAHPDDLQAEQPAKYLKTAEAK